LRLFRLTRSTYDGLWHVEKLTPFFRWQIAYACGNRERFYDDVCAVEMYVSFFFTFFSFLKCDPGEADQVSIFAKLLEAPPSIANGGMKGRQR
jgi:hypothetical protein